MQFTTEVKNEWRYSSALPTYLGTRIMGQNGIKTPLLVFFLQPALTTLYKSDIVKIFV